MKRFSLKFATVTFFAVLVFDAIFDLLSLAGPEHGLWEWFCGIPFWLINFPGYPFIYFFGDTPDGAVIVAVVLAVCLFSALFWSVAVGFYVGRKLPPNTALEPTAESALSSASRATPRVGGGSAFVR